MAAGIFISSVFIDVVTYIFMKLTKGLYFMLALIGFFPKENLFYTSQFDPAVSIIIPAYNEETYVERTINSAFVQSQKPEKVIVIDDCSTDKTPTICKKLQNKYKNLILISQKQNKGKSYNVSHVLKNQELSEITIVLDADTYITENYIKEITKPFTNKRVVISTGMSLPVKPKNFFGKIIYNGATFQYLFFCFRKQAHSFRNAIAVISGDSSAYRTSFLKELGGFPQGTQTEDMDITWVALEKKYKVVFQKKALARSNDPSTLKGHWKQITRWYSGAVQCFYKHRSKLLKAKPLLFTTIIPIYFDSIIYAPVFLAMLIIAFFYPTIALIFYTADFIFTLIAILYLNWKWIFKLPEIYIIKFIWSAAWIFAILKTTIQFIIGKKSWEGTWKRDDFYTKKKSSFKFRIPQLNKKILIKNKEARINKQEKFSSPIL